MHACNIASVLVSCLSRLKLCCKQGRPVSYQHRWYTCTHSLLETCRPHISHSHFPQRVHIPMHTYIHRCHYLRSQLIMQYYYSRYIFLCLINLSWYVRYRCFCITALLWPNCIFMCIITWHSRCRWNSLPANGHGGVTATQVYTIANSSFYRFQG